MGAPRTQKLHLKNIWAHVRASRHICLDVCNLGYKLGGEGPVPRADVRNGGGAAMAAEGGERWRARAPFAWS